MSDRVSGVVHEKPDLVALPEAGMILQLIDQLCPARWTRRRAVYEHDRHASGSMWAHHEKPFPQRSLSTDSEISGPKTGDFKVPNRRSFQGQGEGRSGFVFDGHLDAFDLERAGRVRSVEFQLAAQFPRLERPARIIEAKKSRGGDPNPRWNMRRLFARGGFNRLDHRGKWRPDSGNSVAIPQTAHLDVGGRHKILKAKARPE